MKAAIRILVYALLLILPVAAPSGAGLWPFSSAPEPEPVCADLAVDYLHVNRIAVAETDKTIRIFPAFLQDGMIYVRGRARTAGEGIEAVYFSTDGKKSWQNAAFLSNQTISFGFRPEPGRSYDLYVKVMDRRKQINDVDKTHRVIAITDENVLPVVEDAIDAIITDYENEDPVRFIRHVAGSYEGNALLLNAAVRKDFRLLDAIDLRGTVTRIVAGEKGQILVTLAFTRSAISARSGELIQDSGVTEIIFETAGENLRIRSMMNPVLFGVSKAASIAVGTVHSPENTRILVVSDNGMAGLRPFTEAVEFFQASAGGTGPERTTAAVMQLPFE